MIDFLFALAYFDNTIIIPFNSIQLMVRHTGAYEQPIFFHAGNLRLSRGLHVTQSPILNSPVSDLSTSLFLKKLKTHLFHSSFPP